MKAVSLFSGVGGFEIGFDRAGIETILQVELDPHCRSVLERHWPKTERIEDVRNVQQNASSTERYRRHLEAATGSSDAQRERSGQRSAISHPDLVYEELRAERLQRRELGRIRPNPTDPGAGEELSKYPDLVYGDTHSTDRSQGHRSTGGNGTYHRGSRARGRVDLVYGGFPCQPFSVAGKRKGNRDDRNFWPEFRRVVQELQPRWVVAENVPGLLSFDQGRFFGSILDDLGDIGFNGIAYAILDAQHFGVPQRRRRVFIVAGPSRQAVEQILSICESCEGHPAESGTTGEEIAEPPDDSSQNGSFRTTDLDNQEACIPDVAYAIAAREAKGVSLLESQTNYIPEASQVRRLTPLECERLMGWPDDWTRRGADGKEISDTHRYRMIGNGVVAPVAEWIGHRLVAVDRAIS